MRTSTLLPLALAIIPSLAQNTSLPINITNVESVDQSTRVGQLAYGASNLDFGYSAGAGINFGNGTLGGGFNAGIPGQSEGALGGGWTLTGKNLTFGLGGVYNNVSFNVAVIGDKVTGKITVQVNGKDVAL
ncbi:uncharacterized protein PAC_06370 [Phialocephala subalpina]|uniref:Secreted protein n=1 Tax=Phialocephala subalpina TaxID=576137 RepID=A0A1L7WUM3_9HELO|nr:uncharacterized protein PAC_06370 [Phialocephala subalpina]